MSIDQALGAPQASDVATFEEWTKGFHLHLPELSQDPYPTYERLRGECPIFHSEAHGGFWVLSRYEDVKFVHQHTEIFSTQHIGVPRVDYPLGPEIPLHIDPPEHMKYRRPMLELFSPAEANATEPLARKTAIDLLDAIAAKGGSCDFLAEFAVPFPCIIFCDVMGLPVEELDRFLQWKDDYLRADSAHKAQAMATVYADVMQLFGNIWDERVERGEPGDDLLGKYMTMLYGGERPLSKDEFIHACRVSSSSPALTP